MAKSINETVPTSKDTKDLSPSVRESVQEVEYVEPDKKKLSQKLSLLFAGIALGSDGYQSMIIGSVESCLSRIYGDVAFNDTMSTRVSNAMLIGDIIGQIGFGAVIDRLGRKFGIILCTCFVCLGIALATASNGVTPTGLFWMLVIARGLTGVGVGGEYPCSSVTASEAAEESGRSRGFWLCISGCFIIDFGFLVATIVPVILLAICGMDGLAVVWRLSLGLGILLPISVLYFRLKMLNSDMYRREALTKNIPYWLIIKNYWSRLAITGSIWFLYDFVSYSFGIFSNTILSIAVPGNSLMQTWCWNIVLYVFYPFGALVGAFLVDRLGRRYTMASGFFAAAVLGIIVGALAPQLVKVFPLFVILYGFFLAFGEMGTGDCTILVSAEMYPTAIRGTMYGLSAAIGKAGAAIGTQVFTPILRALTERTGGDDIKAQGYVFIIGACISLIGCALTLLFVPELNNEKLEQQDVEFRQLLEANGYDLSQLGFTTNESSVNPADEERQGK